jgi:hypothetical protein
MSFPTFTRFIKRVVLFFILSSLSFLAFSQKIDSTKAIRQFMAAAYITNNGISLLPNFTLGKPAVVFNMLLGKNKLTFEPELRFAMDGGKPWSFLFWWRYKVIKTDKFAFNVGVHPGIVFRPKTYLIDGVPTEGLVAQRALTGDLYPSYAITKNITVGFYYLHAFGLEKDATQNTDFVAIRGNISNINLSNDFLLRIAPQCYYLNMDGKQGFYTTATLTLTNKKSPLYISSVLSKTIQTQITGKDFVWNISLHYAFNQKYIGI